MGSGSASGLGGVHRSGAGVNSASIQIIGSRYSEDGNERDSKIVGIRGAGVSQKTISLITSPVLGTTSGTSIGSTSRENFIALVVSMDKAKESQVSNPTRFRTDQPREP